MRVLWQPKESLAELSQMRQFIRFVNDHTNLKLATFRDLHTWSVEHYEQFWKLFCLFAGIIFQRESQQSVLLGNSFIETRFFPEATINFAQNLLRFASQAEYRSKIAVISVLENGRVEKLSWQQLAATTASFQQFLNQVNFKSSQVAAVCLPNQAAALISLLAVTACGGVFSSASPDFGMVALLDRFGQIDPTVLILCDGYFFKGKTIDVTSKMVELSQQLPTVKTVVVFDFIGQSEELVKKIKQTATQLQLAITAQDIFTTYRAELPSFVPITFNDPVYIMFSSGTTGKPKCLVQGPGVLLNQVKEHLLHNDMRSRDCLFYYTTCGWMMWHWQAAALFCGTTLLLYDGNPFYPHNGRLFDLCREHGVTVLGTSARYLQILQQQQFHLSEVTLQKQIRLLLSTGSPLLEETHIYVQENILPETQICSISGGTDLNGCFLLGNPLEPVIAGQLQGPALGMKISVLNEKGEETEEEGELVCDTPFPSMPLRFLHDQDNQKYLETYFSMFPNRWRHGDFVKKTPQGGYIISGRSDATLNPGGVRIGTAEIYRVVELMPQVADSLVVGIPVAGDVAVVLFVVLSSIAKEIPQRELSQQIKEAIRTKLSFRHVPAAVFFVPEIPLTVNGKKSEIAVKNILSNRPVTNRDFLQNPQALLYFEQEKDNILQTVLTRQSTT